MTHSKPGASTPNLGAQWLPVSGRNPYGRRPSTGPPAGTELHNSEPVEPTRSGQARPSYGGSRAFWPNLLNLVSAGVGPAAHR